MEKQIASAQTALSAIIDSETLLSRLPVKDRQRFETQVAACEGKTTSGPPPMNTTPRNGLRCIRCGASSS